MGYILEGFRRAFHLVITLDREVLSIALVSIKVSTAAIILAALIGVPLGFSVAVKKFRGRRAVVTILNTLMALPTVVVGLTVYSLLSRRGPFGSLGLLYTSAAMVIGQFILATPIIAALSLSAAQGLDKRVIKTAFTLGATGFQSTLAAFAEARFALLSAVIAGFGRIFAEVGASIMLGGNIRGFTRNLTTAIAFETGKGEFGLAIALGMILLIVAFFINILFYYLQKRDD